MKKVQLYYKCYKYIIKNKPILLPIIIAMSISNALRPFINIWMVSTIVNSFSGYQDFSFFITGLLVGLSLIMITSILSEGLYETFQELKKQLWQLEKIDIEKTLYKISYNKFDNSDFQDLVKRYVESIDGIASPFLKLVDLTRNFLTGITSIVCSLILIKDFVLTLFSYKISKSIIVTLFIILLSSISFIALILIISRKATENWNYINGEYKGISRIYDTFKNIVMDYKTGKEIRVYQCQDFIENEAISKLRTDGKKLIKKAANQAAFSNSIIAIIAAIIGLLIYSFLGVCSLSFNLSSSFIIETTGAFSQIITGVTLVASTIGKEKMVLPYAKDFFKILSCYEESTYGTIDICCNFINIEFKNVYFKYPNQKNYALKNVSFKIDKLDKVALVGRNGSGKSTIIKLLCRLYDADEGEILINGINIKKISKKSLDNVFSIVAQDFSLFSMGIDNNVSSSEYPDKNKILEILKKVNLIDVINKLPLNEKSTLYKDTDKNGVELSGGELQKLAIGRSVYKNSSVIIFDEPTAALDPKSEYKIIENFRELSKEKTSIFVTHRLYSCRFCNKIIVVKEGIIYEQGTHEELLKIENGEYYKLWNAQASFYNC